MDKKVVFIKTDDSKFYLQYLRLIDPMLKLRESERKVVAELIKHYNNTPENLANEHRWLLVFDYDTKVKISDAVGIGPASIHNILSQLRRKGIIKNNTLVDKVLIKPPHQQTADTKRIFELTYYFDFNEGQAG